MLIAALRDLQWSRQRFIIAIVGTWGHFAATLVLTGLANGFRIEAQRTVESGIDTFGHAFQPEHHRRTTVVHHLGLSFVSVTPRIMRPPGPFPDSASQPCRPAATTIHCEEPLKGQL
jgi:hypothetical protein